MSAFHFEMDEPFGGATLLYDGECPFCSAYVRMVTLRTAVGGVRLVDARVSDDSIVDKVTSRGFDLNEGMAFTDRRADLSRFRLHTRPRAPDEWGINSQQAERAAVQVQVNRPICLSHPARW